MDGGGFYGGGGGGGGGGGQFDQDGGGFYGGEGGANAGASQGGGSQGNSQTSGQDKRATRTLVPLTIKQIINATQDHPDDDFKVDGHEVAQIIIVGMVIESNETATNLTYTIEDGTGNITVKKWLDSEGDAPAPGAATEGCGKGSYVKVIGQLRSFRDSRNIVAFEVRPIANMNEVTHHFLSAIHTHLQKTGAGASAAAPVMANSAGAYAAGGQQAAFGFGGGGAADGMSKAQSAVLAFFKSYAEVESGGSVTDCIKMLAGQGIAEAKVRETVENLTEEGHLYSTVDENHYQSTG